MGGFLSREDRLAHTGCWRRWAGFSAGRDGIASWHGGLPTHTGEHKACPEITTPNLCLTTPVKGISQNIGNAFKDKIATNLIFTYCTIHGHYRISQSFHYIAALTIFPDLIFILIMLLIAIVFINQMVIGP